MTNAFDMKDHVAVVTGGGSGIGRAVCLRLAQDGIPVVVQDIGAEKAEAVAREITDGGGRARAIGGDVANEADVKAIFATCRDAYGPCTLLNANAGYGQVLPFTEITPADFDRMIAVHLRGVFLCDREALGPMLERGAGVIINTASQQAQKGGLEHGHYAAAKAAIIGLTKSLAREVSPKGVRANVVAPGPVETPIWEGVPEHWRARIRAGVPLERFAEAWEVAETIAFLASPGAALYVGQTLGPNCGDVML